MTSGRARGRMMGATDIKRMTGMEAVATAALAVLVFGCVFAITVGPREVLKTRTQALRQTIAATPPTDQAIAVQTTWTQLNSEFAYGNPSVNENLVLSPADVGDITGQLRGDLGHGLVTLAPPATDWTSMTTALRPVLSTLPTGGVVVKMEVSYRQPLAGHVRLVAGSLSSSARTDSRDSSISRPALPVVVTQQTARQFRLHVGSSLSIPATTVVVPGESAGIRLTVVGIVAPTDPGSAFWTADPTVAAPSLVRRFDGPSYWVAGVFAAADQAVAMQREFGIAGLNIQWTLPMSLGSLTGDQAQPLDAALQRLATQSPRFTGPMAPASNALAVMSGPVQALTAFGTSASEVDVLLWLLYASLAVTGAVVLLLAARMLALRRSAELRLRRARGASLGQVAAATARGASIAAIPAAAFAVVAAVLAVPGQAPPGGWWPALITLAVSIGAPAAFAARQHRLGDLSRRGHGATVRAQRGRRRRRAGTRLVIEATACAAAIAGIVVLREQGPPTGGGIDLYTSAAPVLVAIPVVIVVLRGYPLVLHLLLKGSARGRGAASFIGLARAARVARAASLPAFALVLAVTVAAFSGMVRDAVTRGEVNASWQAAGADATVSGAGPATISISPAAQRALAAVPGVTRSAVAAESDWSAPGGTSVTVIAVDPASYAALVSSTQTWPAVNPRLLTGDSVLASPQAVTDLGGGGTGTLTAGNGSLRVRIAGTLSGTPALAAGGAFVLASRSALRGHPGLDPDVMLFAGASIDASALTRVAQKVVPGTSVTIRSPILQGLTAAPLQRGAFLLFGLAIGVAAGLGLAALLLELALGAADRDLTLARLVTMGLGGRQRTRLVLTEVLPVVLAAAVAAIVSAAILPRLVAPAIDLSVFTGSDASVPLVPDAASLVLPLLGLAVVTAVALTIEIRAGRRGVAASLRGTE
jgi:putative ABC transport system permease protein